MFSKFSVLSADGGYMKLYLSNNYVNCKDLLTNKYPFIFGTGARGIGKTYGILSELIKILKGSNRKFIYLRRTMSQVELLLKPEFNPFKSINSEQNTDISPFRISKNSSGFYHSHLNEDNELVPEGSPIGYIFALSTFFNLRSVDFSDVDYIFYDEFIPEEIEKKLRGEGEAFLNLLETVGRNRELKGLPPLKVICMSNSNKLENALYMTLNLVNIATMMQEKDLEEYVVEDRGIQLLMYMHSPISEAKKDTALYKMSEGTDFYGMAIDNKFTKDDQSLVKKNVNIKEYTPLVIIGKLTILKHKRDNKYYVTMVPAGGCSKKFTTKDHDKDKFCCKYMYLYINYHDKLNVNFDSYETEINFRNLFN